MKLQLYLDVAVVGVGENLPRVEEPIKICWLRPAAKRCEQVAICRRDGTEETAKLEQEFEER